MKRTVATHLRQAAGLAMASLFVLLLGGLGPSAHAAGFDCKKAGTRIEKMICGDTTLSDLDGELSNLYSVEEDAPSNDPRRVAQRAWIARRNACGSAACVENQYHLRLVELACDEKGPNAGQRFAAFGCLNHQLWLLDRELDAVERTHTDELAKNSHSPDVMRELAVREAKAWREYREAKCGLYGNREGDGGTWQAFWALNCEVGDTKDRIKALKDD